MKIKITGAFTVPTWYSNKIGEVFEVAEVAENGDVRVKNENEMNSMWVFKGSFEEVQEKKYMRYDEGMRNEDEFNIKNVEGHEIETLEETKNWLEAHVDNNYEDEYDDDEFDELMDEIEKADFEDMQEILSRFDYGLVEIDEDGNGFLD